MGNGRESDRTARRQFVLRRVAAIGYRVYIESSVFYRLFYLNLTKNYLNLIFFYNSTRYKETERGKGCGKEGAWWNETHCGIRQGRVRANFKF